MALSKIDVVNLSLILTGAEKISSLTAATKSARLASTMFEFSAKGMFELVNWKFATARQELSALSTDPAFGKYDYQYQLPAKCLRPIALVDEDDDETEYEWRQEVAIVVSDGREVEYDVILTNQDEGFLKYLRYRDNVGCWPAWFARLVALDLAILLCEPLKQDKQKKNQLLLMMTDPIFGWLRKAIDANAMSDVDVTDENVRKDFGNTDVIDAASRDEVTKKYIQIRTS